MTGEGQYIDLSQGEAALHLLSPAMLDQTVKGLQGEEIEDRPAAAINLPVEAAIPEDIMEKATPVGGAIIKLRPYYEEEPASE